MVWEWKQVDPVEEPIAEEPRGGIPPISMGKLTPEDQLTPGYYAVPVRGRPNPGVDDYIRLGGFKGPASNPDEIVDRPPQ